MGDRNRKRVTLKHKHPNPLFEQWLCEWRDKAKEQDSKMQYCFSNALCTLRKYPLPLESGKDCKILKGFGDKLCSMLDEKLKEHKSQDQVNSPQKVKANKPIPRSKEYMPQIGSGAFAILVTLYEKTSQPGHTGYLTKAELIEHGQRLCNMSFTKPGPGTYYTGWSSMKTLLEKALVIKRGNPAKFSLTNEGSALADQLFIIQKVEEFKKLEEKNECIQHVASLGDVSFCPEPVKPKEKEPISRQISSASTSTQSSTELESVIIAPESFKILLLVDTQELNGSKGDIENDPLIQELKNLGVCHEVRNLKVGDYAWICQDNSGHELILPYIVERKRMDDLGESIKDTRFHEQKFRLKQCGIQNLIYLIENFGKNEHVGLPINTLYQAAVNTSVHDGFTVKFTQNGKESCRFLDIMTVFLTNLFKKKTLVGCSKEDLPPLALDDDLVHLMVFKDFNKNSAKSRHFKVSEMFVKHLLQIKGMSVDKAMAIVEKYPTPRLLKSVYMATIESDREKLLSNIRYGPLKKNVGPVLSKTVHQFFSTDLYR